MSLCDIHCHTERSACAEDVSLDWYVEIARNSDAVFAVTDHSAQLYYPTDNRWAFWGDTPREIFETCRESGPQRIAQYIEDIRAAQTGGMLLGIELDIFIDGTVVCDEDRLGDFDILLGVAHTFPALKAEAGVTAVYAEFKQMVEHLSRVNIDALAHPFRPMVGNGYEISDDLIKWLVDIAGEFNFALEINSHSICRDEDIRMARMAYDHGVGLSVATDTHRKSEFGDFSYHKEIAHVTGVSADELYWCPAVPGPVEAF
jgi:histidinol phosphatase-like PHP family hydrolase